MRINYHPEIRSYVKKLDSLLSGQEIVNDQVKIELDFGNAFNYAVNLAPVIRRIGDLRLSMLKESGLEGLAIPFIEFNPKRTFGPGEYVSAEEIVMALRILETYDAIQSIQMIQDVEKRELLENILGGQR